MIRTALIVLGLSAGTALAQTPVVVRDAGPGFPGRLLRAALAAPHQIIDQGPNSAELPAGKAYPTTVIVFARHVTVAAEVRGDVIVVGGDLFVHPGGHITGRAIAIGGGSYPSMLGNVDGGEISFRDETFDVVRDPNGISLDYKPLTEYPGSPVTFPGILGFRIPTYDRTNGLSVPFGPELATDSMRYVLDPAVTYRSQLGVVDPSLDGTYQFNRLTAFDVSAERGTFTNDRWIKTDVVNSVTSLWDGNDARNWYRADRGSITGRRKWEGLNGTLEPSLGFDVERAWSVRPDSDPTGGPWSLFDRKAADSTDSRLNGRLRPNPPVTRGTISSIDVGLHGDWSDEGIVAKMDTKVEVALHAPGGLDDDGQAPSDTRFTQETFNGSVIFPTFGVQRFRVEVHAVGTEGAAPPQRWAYLGGSGTLGTLNMLQLGGDQLLLVDSRYEFPLTAIKVPVVGSPVFALRHIIGSAGVGHLPALTQIVGVRLALVPFETELLMDTSKRKVIGTAGISFVR